MTFQVTAVNATEISYIAKTGVITADMTNPIVV